MPHAIPEPYSTQGALAPHGRLRVAINTANPVLVDGRDGTSGVAPTIGVTIGGLLGVPVDLVPYPSAAAVSEDAERGRWDIALIASDPARAAAMLFSRPYARIPATYLARKEARFESGAAVDRNGVTVIAERGSAYHLWLSAHLEHARIATYPTAAESLAAYRADETAVLAGLRSTLREAAATTHGVLLADDFMHIEQAVAIEKGAGEAGRRAIDQMIRAMLLDGTVSRIIEDSGQSSKLVVADP